MALPAGFLDELRARTPLAAVIGRRVKLARSGRNLKGCCPFHGEKTPSFYVYDDHFHCFGCGVHGDAISFVMQSEGAAFPEAVERLAREAGMEVPKPSPQAAEADQRRHDLHGVLAAAATAFQRRLRLPEGARALDYLRGRGLSEDTIARFGLGWSGEGRGALTAELGREGITQAQLIDAGLVRPGEDGRAPYDLFFNRVMFPIRDRRGQVISFGGRIMGDGQPKYVNGPETELFSKRRHLYGLDLARAAVRADHRLVVVEGYMDVIALHQAGFPGAVAPLGTALTEDQLEELWRLSPVPVLCFDGDAAGGRAAARAAELALPLLTAERSLRLATLPPSEDPDTLVRKQGAAAFTSVLNAARPLADALFDLLREGSGDGSPEQRAGFRARLMEAAGRIRDTSLSIEYRQALLDKFRATRVWTPSGRGRGTGNGRFGTQAGKPPPLFHRPTATAEGAMAEQGRNLVTILLRHPYLLHDVEEAFGEAALPDRLARLRDAILQWGSAAETLDSAGLMTHLTETGLAADAAQALSAVPYPLPACAAADAMPAEAEAGWWHIFGLMHRERLEEEVAAAMRDLADRGDEATQRRLIALCTARNALRQGEQDDDQS
jgi:DNA primase